jgi:hypothetical protein
MLDEITALIDAGAGGGIIRFYDGTQPSNGGTVTNLVAACTFSTTSFPAAAAASMAANTITDDTNAVGGITTWFRVVDSDFAFVMDGTVTATSGGGDIELAGGTTIGASATVSVSTFTITAGNAGV